MKKTHKKSALSHRLKAKSDVQLPARVVTDARVLDLPGLRAGYVVDVPLELLPAWYAFHGLEVVGGKREPGVVIVRKR